MDWMNQYWINIDELARPGASEMQHETQSIKTNEEVLIDGE